MTSDQEETAKFSDEYIPVQLCPPQISHGLDWTRTSKMESRRL